LVLSSSPRHRAGFLPRGCSKRTFFFGSKSSQYQNNSNSGSTGGFFKDKRFQSSSDIGLQWTATLSDPQEVVPEDEDLPSRTEQLRRLQDIDQEYDILVIGGGATGAGVALDAATRGFKVACIERGDFASETSSRSTKLLWAGIKYMGSAFAYILTPKNYQREGFRAVAERFWSEMNMVYHCHVERHYMTTVNRHLCDWIAICCPFTTWIKIDDQGRYPLNQWLFCLFPIVAPVVMKFYDALSGFSCPPSYILTAKTARTAFPQLKQDGYDDGTKLKYCSVFYEAIHNDSRTNLAIAMTAATKGAHICNYVEAMELVTTDDGKVRGARVLDRLTGKEWTVKAKKVVLAGGPFTDALRHMEYEKDTTAKEKEFSPAVRGAHGSHIVLPGKYISPDVGMLNVQTRDNRFLFILPWMGHTLVGTTDAAGPAQTLPQPPEDEIDWLLNEAQAYLKKDDSLTWSRQDVLSAWRGWRPLAVDPFAEPGGQVSRDHIISYNPNSDVFFIAGGKWTTWREMASDIIDRVAAKLVPTEKEIPDCVTKKTVLWGGERGYSDSLIEQLQELYPDMEHDVVVHLVKTYGGHVWNLIHSAASSRESSKDTFHSKRLVPEFPYLEAEVPYACQEYACTIEDILSRRTRLAYLNREAALEALPKVADLMAKTLGWSNKVKKAQVKAAKHYIETFGGPVPHTSPPLTPLVE
jgi:glycerol-3-phosphate dehydrogenase